MKDGRHSPSSSATIWPTPACSHHLSLRNALLISSDSTLRASGALHVLKTQGRAGLRREHTWERLYSKRMMTLTHSQGWDNEQTQLYLMRERWQSFLAGEHWQTSCETCCKIVNTHISLPQVCSGGLLAASFFPLRFIQEGNILCCGYPHSKTLIFPNTLANWFSLCSRHFFSCQGVNGSFFPWLQLKGTKLQLHYWGRSLTHWSLPLNVRVGEGVYMQFVWKGNLSDVFEFLFSTGSPPSPSPSGCGSHQPLFLAQSVGLPVLPELGG